MNILKRMAEWTGGSLCFFMGLFSLSVSILVGSFFIFASLILIPISRKFIERIIKRRLSFKIKTAAVTIFLVGGFTAISVEAWRLGEIKEQQQAEKRKEDKIAYFRQNKKDILFDIRDKLAKKDLSGAIAEAREYLVVEDEQLQDVYSILQETEKAERERKRKEEERKSKIEKQFSAWDGSHRSLEFYIKQSMHDPSSYKHDSTHYIDNGDHLIIVTRYRGKNLFGAYIRGSTRAKVSLDGDILDIIE